MKGNDASLGFSQNPFLIFNLLLKTFQIFYYKHKLHKPTLFRHEIGKHLRLTI